MKIKMKRHEHGRSMIEMLGVLAIIGMLSIGGLYALNIAIAQELYQKTVKAVLSSNLNS